MPKVIRKYDRVGARQMREINKERQSQGLKPLKRKRKKTMRTYRYSGNYVGINGGETRVFTDPKTQKLMENTSSVYVDDYGNTLGTKRKEYQGKYPEWFKRNKVEKVCTDDDDSWQLYNKNVDAKIKSVAV